MNNFPEIRKAIEEANVIELPQSGSKVYKFKTFAFGERGTKLSSKLLKEITVGLTDSVKTNFPKLIILYLQSLEVTLGEFWLHYKSVKMLIS